MSRPVARSWFLMVKAGERPETFVLAASLVVVQHWGEELKRLVPPD